MVAGLVISSILGGMAALSLSVAAELELASALVAYAVGGFLTSLGFVLRADRVNARILSAK